VRHRPCVQEAAATAWWVSMGRVPGSASYAATPLHRCVLGIAVYRLPVFNWDHESGFMVMKMIHGIMIVIQFVS
jgi:hypothetical protein